jgi:hypothetical protein
MKKAQAVPARAALGADGLEEDLARTEAVQFRGRSLTYVRALRYLREIVTGPDRVSAVAARLEQVWDRREFQNYFSRPFLLLAALRAEALASTDHPLARGFATENPDPLAVTRDAILASLTPERSGVWILLSSRGVQTNEVSRSVVWKWPAELAGWGNRSRPVALVDVGASGGLNLIADRLPDCWNDGAGKPLRVASKVDVCLRVGFDVQPLDFHRDDDVAWARACIWAGAAQRVERFDRAVREWRCAEQFEVPPALHKLNASLVPARLPELLARVPTGGVLVLVSDGVPRIHGVVPPPAIRGRRSPVAGKHATPSGGMARGRGHFRASGGFRDRRPRPQRRRGHPIDGARIHEHSSGNRACADEGSHGLREVLLFSVTSMIAVTKASTMRLTDAETTALKSPFQ